MSEEKEKKKKRNRMNESEKEISCLYLYFQEENLRFVVRPTKVPLRSQNGKFPALYQKKNFSIPPT